MGVLRERRPQPEERSGPGAFRGAFRSSTMMVMTTVMTAVGKGLEAGLSKTSASAIAASSSALAFREREEPPLVGTALPLSRPR
jgi:hypothetical protein